MVFTRLAGAALLACAGYVIGTQGAIERQAVAAPTAADDCRVLVNQITPPAIVISANERAVVGGADGLFYLINYDGEAIEVRASGRERRDPDSLFWHPGPLKF